MNCPKCGAPLVAGSGFCSGCGLQVATAAGTPAKKSNKMAVGIIIAAVVCVMAIPVIGIIAAIAIPNLLMAVQRGKQKRTMGDMKTIASAIEQYNVDNRHYPAAGNMDELCGFLTPDYLATCIRHDGWHSKEHPRDFAYAAWGGTPEGCQAEAGSPDCGPREYGLASAGKDAMYEVSNFGEYGERQNGSFNNDIVIRSGQFISQPWGKQGNGPAPQAGDAPPTAPPDTAPEPEMPPPPVE